MVSVPARGGGQQPSETHMLHGRGAFTGVKTFGGPGKLFAEMHFHLEPARILCVHRALATAQAHFTRFGFLDFRRPFFVESVLQAPDP